MELRVHWFNHIVHCSVWCLIFQAVDVAGMSYRANDCEDHGSLRFSGDLSLIVMQVSSSHVQHVFSNVFIHCGFALSAKQTQILFCSDQWSYGEITTKLECLRSSDEIRVLPTKCWRSWDSAMDKACTQQMLHKAFLGKQKEIIKELEEIRVAQHWVNQEVWDVASEA